MLKLSNSSDVAVRTITASRSTAISVYDASATYKIAGVNNTGIIYGVSLAMSATDLSSSLSYNTIDGFLVMVL